MNSPHQAQKNTKQSGLARRNFQKLRYQALGQVSMPLQNASVNAPVLHDNEPAASSTAWSDTSNTSIGSSLLGSISPK